MNAAATRPIDRVLGKLNYIGSRDRNGQYQCHCPAHDDSTASLSVKEADDGRVLLKCHADCSTEAVVQVLGLTMIDLMPPKENRRKNTLGPIVARYDYRDDEGRLLFQVTRHSPKTFRQQRPDGKGGWIPNLDSVYYVPYRLPDLLAADPVDWVFVVEGEKDADALHASGLVATCNVGGAGKWHIAYGEWLLNRRVCVLPDNDEPGYRHAHSVAQSLQEAAKTVRLVELPGLPLKGDVSDWLQAGGTPEQLLALVEDTPDYVSLTPNLHGKGQDESWDDDPPWLSNGNASSGHYTEDDIPNNLNNTDVYERYPFLIGIPPETIQEWLGQWRAASATEGGRSWTAWDFIEAYANRAEREEAIPGLLPRGEVMVIVGETGSGKSWLHVRMAVERATGNPVLGVYEAEAGNVLCCLTEGKEGFSKRLRAHLQLFNVGRENCHVHVRDNLPELITPKGYGIKEAGGMAWFLSIRADQHRDFLPDDLTLIFIDYLREASLGATENSNDDMALVMRAANQLARALLAGVILFHHQGSNGDGSKVGRGATVMRDMAYSWFLLDGKVEHGAEKSAKLRCDKPPKDHPTPAPVQVTLDMERQGYPVLVYVGETAIGKTLASEVYDWVRRHPERKWGRSALEQALPRPAGVIDETWSRRIKVAYERLRDEASKVEYPGIQYIRGGIQFAPKEPSGRGNDL